MPQYFVMISDPITDDLTVAAGTPIRPVRDVWWNGEAESPEEARRIALEQAAIEWPNKYAGDELPADPAISVQLGPNVCSTCLGRGWVPRYLPLGVIDPGPNWPLGSAARRRCPICDGKGRQ